MSAARLAAVLQRLAAQPKNAYLIREAVRLRAQLGIENPMPAPAPTPPAGPRDWDINLSLGIGGRGPWVNVRIRRGVHLAIKARAAASGLPLSDYLRALLELQLERGPPDGRPST